MPQHLVVPSEAVAVVGAVAQPRREGRRAEVGDELPRDHAVRLKHATMRWVAPYMRRLGSYKFVTKWWDKDPNGRLTLNGDVGSPAAFQDGRWIISSAKKGGTEPCLLFSDGSTR